MALNAGELEFPTSGRKTRCKKGNPLPKTDPAEMLLTAINNPGICFVCLGKGDVSTGMGSSNSIPRRIKCPKCFPKEYQL